MGRRGKVKGKPGAYVERDREGKFKDWTSVYRSIRADMGKTAKFHPKKSGYGHLGDYL
jgi:hypothetical protein